MSVKLHLGCGSVIIPGFINADVTPGEKVDLVFDINNLVGLKQYPWYGKVDFVYLSHVLEHFPTAKVPGILQELHELLGNGGKIRISVPDLDRICKLYVEHFDWFKPPHVPWVGLIYGGQIDEYDFHKTGYNFAYLEWLLVQTGFTNVVEIDGSDDLGVIDGSQSAMPFGKISTTVEATKGTVEREHARFRYTPVERTLAALSNFVARVLTVLVRVRIVLIRRRVHRSR